MTEQPDTTDDAPTTCGNTRALPDETTVTCGRPPAHTEDHYDDTRGIAWANEADDAAGLTQEERAHRQLDRVRVPRHRHEHALTLVQRQSLFIDRIGERLHTQVDNNMILMETCRETAILLKGAPGASSFRIKQAIAKLDAVTTPTKAAAPSPGGRRSPLSIQ